MIYGAKYKRESWAHLFLRKVHMYLRPDFSYCPQILSRDGPLQLKTS